MSPHRPTQVAERIAHLAAEFLSRESNRQSLITVTRADISPDLKQATVYVSVFPPEQEEHALNFIRRLRSEFRTFVKQKAILKSLPFFEFEIDYGEKNRQALEELPRG